MPAHGFQKSENLFFTDFFLPVYIFGHRQAKNGDGKKNMGCKKNSGVKKGIPTDRFPQQVCLQIKIIFTCALTRTAALIPYNDSNGSLTTDGHQRSHPVNLRSGVSGPYPESGGVAVY